MTGSVAGVSGLTLRYGKVTALDNVTLEIPEGRMVGLIGPDGVGKSSLLSLLAGARVIQQGKVEVLGGDMRDVAHRNRVCPRTAYMPQGLGKNLYPTLSVFENVDFFGRLLCAPGQAAHLIGNHRKTFTCRAGARRFNGGVEGQQVGLLRH